jgi:hypothetical protein
MLLLNELLAALSFEQSCELEGVLAAVGLHPQVQIAKNLAPE